jgi:TupA-like ATPgrasp
LRRGISCSPITSSSTPTLDRKGPEPPPAQAIATERQTFSERIKERLRLWYGEPPRKGQWNTRRYALHQLRERYAVRRRDDPESAWRCCAFWQRTLINKWNSREFVSKYGGAVPALYWRAYAPSEARLRTLPTHFVIRPLFGSSRKGVYVVADGRDLLRGEPFSAATLRRSILRTGTFAWTRPILAEEFVRSEDGQYRLPVEYKCHTFGDTVAAVQVIERSGVKTGRHRFYTADWRAFRDPMSTRLPQADFSDPPRCLGEMLDLAARLGTAVGTYLRIDFFATSRGCVFNEFSSTPFRGEGFTAFCDDLFGRLWAEKFPSAT